MKDKSLMQIMIEAGIIEQIRLEVCMKKQKATRSSGPLLFCWH